MQRFKNILYMIEYADSSRSALDLAVALAKRVQFVCIAMGTVAITPPGFVIPVMLEA